LSWKFIACASAKHPTKHPAKQLSNTLKSTLPSAWYYLLYPQLVSSFGGALIGVISFGAN
jgi:hypothetical protein